MLIKGKHMSLVGGETSIGAPRAGKCELHIPAHHEYVEKVVLVHTVDKEVGVKFYNTKHS